MSLDYAAYAASSILLVEYITKDSALPTFAYFHKSCWGQYRSMAKFAVCGMRYIISIDTTNKAKCYKCRKLIDSRMSP